MSKYSISFNQVDLRYASVAFKERSLKTLLSKIVSRNHEEIDISDIHALKKVSFEINQGERVGLLGHNGAGKSTLLKTIAGLYPISSGKIHVQGELRSLFDLSLGFEPDATGRENIMYRGLLLGLEPKYISKRMDDIIEFADIGNFIDYPIKTYSAGMMVRLAFAISTSVGGDILLLDEVIGAGDASFMNKAKERILELIKQSKILVLASHELPTLETICNRGLVLHRGEVIFDGDIKEATLNYKKVNKLT